MNILFCSLMYPIDQEKSLKSKLLHTDLPVAANVFQNNMIQGFLENDIKNLYCVNSLPVGTWPRQYKDIYLPEKEINLNGISCINTQTLNIMGLKQISRMHSSLRNIKKYIQKNINPIIITYNFYLPYYLVFRKLKKKGYRFHLCTLVTDLPNQYGIVSGKGMYKILSNLIGRISMGMTKYADCFVLLSEHMKYPLKVGDRPYVIVEGFAHDDYSPLNKELSFLSKAKTIVYTGTLNREFGVEMLIDAFQHLGLSDVELHLYGCGDMVDQIKQISIINPKIIYYGSVSRIEALAAQQSATILINPRCNNKAFTKYSFPSKTMEYLVSGRPLVAYLLDGMPSEYGLYIYQIKENSVESMCDCLLSVLQKSENELKQFGIRAREFVLNKKNRKDQTKKILYMLQSKK